MTGFTKAAWLTTTILLIAACTPTPTPTPHIASAPGIVTPGQGFAVTIVGFDPGAFVTICGLEVRDPQETPGAAGTTVLSGTVPLQPGGDCRLAVTSAAATASVAVTVVELLAGSTIGYYVDADPTGVYRFTKYLQDSALAGTFDLVLYPDWSAFADDVAIGTTPDLMLFSLSDIAFGPSHWPAIEDYLATGQGRAIVMTYCLYDQASVDVWGLGAVDTGTDCYDGDDQATFRIAPALTAGDDAGLALMLPGYTWTFAFAVDTTEADVEVFCTDTADPAAACGVVHRDYPAALVMWLPEAMARGQGDDLLLQIARSLH